MKFDVANGIVKYKSLKTNPTFMNNFDTEIPPQPQTNLFVFNNSLVTSDLMYNGVLRSINIFAKQTKRSNSNAHELIKRLETMDKSKLSSIYIGKHNTQYYAQYINYNNNPNGESLSSTNQHNSNRASNFLIEFSNRQSKTKSTLNSFNLISNNGHHHEDLTNTNQNSLILKEDSVQSNKIEAEKFADLDDIYDDEEGSLAVRNEFIGWYFFETQQKLNSYVQITLTYQVIGFVISIVAIVIATAFVVKRYGSKLYCLNRILFICICILISRNSTSKCKIVESEKHSTSERELRPRTILHQSSAPTISSTSSSSGTKTLFGDDDFSDDDNGDVKTPFDNKTYDSRFLNEFTDIKLIGKGGFGHVFSAKHKIDNRMFAIKRIHLKNR